MDIFPAIDLREGRCVRLTQGDFDRATIYDADPLDMAEKFVAAGAEWLHLVDLDGAKAGASRQFRTVAAIARRTKLKLQVGGGFRNADMVARAIGDGAERVVLGSLAAEDPALVKQFLRRFGPDSITLAFDVRYNGATPEILTRGWQENSRKSLWDVLADYDGSGLKNILCTDVSRDGMLAGPNLPLYREICARQPALDVLASGGVGSLEDLFQLSQTGVTGVVVGKAIYEERFELKDALVCAKADWLRGKKRSAGPFFDM